jgi:pilus assembly protein Flp/PilA
MKTFIKNFMRDESGASAAEYALILAIVGVAIGAAALTLGANVSEAIGNAATDVYNCNHAETPEASATPGTDCPAAGG